MAPKGPRQQVSLRGWLTVDDLHHLPQPEWLIEDILANDGFASLYGREGIGKSFIAMSLALSVATGTDWHGRRVTQADVVYVAGEGAHGLRSRISAWQQRHGAPDLSKFHLDPRPLQLLDPADVEAFEHTRALHFHNRPSLVVLDTLSRCMAGADENSSKDMSAAIAAIDRIRADSSSVLIVHHASKRGGERGHSAFAAAADTRIEVSSGPSLTCVKQRNAPQFEDLHFRLVATGESCVLEHVTRDGSKTAANAV